MSAHTSRRVVVITGANEGIGYHMLQTLLEDGYRVAALDIETNQLQSLQETHPDHLLVTECDVTDDDGVEAAMSETP